MSQTSRSRYKDAPVFTDTARGDYYGLADIPPEFADLTPADYGQYAVTSGDEGFPDRITDRVYGGGAEDLWWIVALVNGIIDTESELIAGRVLRIPPRSAVQVFLSRV